MMAANDIENILQFRETFNLQRYAYTHALRELDRYVRIYNQRFY